MEERYNEMDKLLAEEKVPTQTVTGPAALLPVVLGVLRAF